MIKFYKRDGSLESVYELTNDNLGSTMGMLSRVILKDGKVLEGYSDPLRLEGKYEEYDGLVHDYIYLWTLKNLDEETHTHNVQDGISIEKVNISDIEEMHSILYSHPRWGGKLTNKFWIDIK